MASYDYDLITIGAGSGGVRASRMAGGYGAKVAVIEEVREGGTCVLRGCVPKQLLVYGSHVPEEIAQASYFINCNRRLEPLGLDIIRAANDEQVRMRQSPNEMTGLRIRIDGQLIGHIAK